MLDDLVEVIEALKSRIDKHRAVLQGNEAQTRMSLIDPLLRALGWDTADPALVRPEYTVGGRRADYALLNAEGNVVVFLEAKNLGEQLANHRSQVVAYASELGIRFPALTNGNEWEVYDNSQLVPIEQRRVLSVSTANAEPAKCALQLLLLWRPNLASGQPIEANEPVMGTEPQAYASSAPIRTPMQNEPVESDAGWVNLKDFVATSGTTPPKLRFPGGDVLQPSSWRGLLIEVAEWLIRDGALTQDKCPVSVGRNANHCVVNVRPVHPDGTAFTPYKLSNGLFLAHDVSVTKANNIVRRSRALIEHLGEDPATVHVQVG